MAVIYIKTCKSINPGLHCAIYLTFTPLMNVLWIHVSTYSDQV